MDWRTGLLTLALVYHANGFSKYGRTCRDIGCLNSEVCVLADDPCPIGHSSNCGTYPTCKKKTAVEGSHAEPQPSVPRPTPARPQTPTRDDSAPNYPPPAPPAGSLGGNSYGGGSPPYGFNSGGSNYPGGQPSYSGGSPYNIQPTYGGGSPYNGHPTYGGGSPYNGQPSYGGQSPYATNTHGGGPTYGGGSSNGGSSPYATNNNRGGNSPSGGSSLGGFGSSGGKSPLDSIFNSLSKYASGGQGSGGSSSGSGGSLSGIFGSILGDLNKSGGIGSLFSNTRPIQANPNYSAPNSRNSNTQHYPSGYQNYNQPPAQSRNQGQSHARPNAASTYKPATYGWNVG